MSRFLDRVRDATRIGLYSVLKTPNCGKRAVSQTGRGVGPKDLSQKSQKGICKRLAAAGGDKPKVRRSPLGGALLVKLEQAKLL